MSEWISPFGTCPWCGRQLASFDVPVCRDCERKRLRAVPDWEGFGKAVMEAWPVSDVSGFDLQEMAERHHIIVEVKGGFDPEKHTDPIGAADAGDRWFMRNYDAATKL